MNRNVFRGGRWFVVVFFGLTMATSLTAQSARGTINGVVKDTTGAVIPGSLVTVTNQGTGTAATAQSQADGFYMVPQLLPGYYGVSATAAGFKRLNIQDLKLDVGTTLTQDVVLEVGQVTENVTVSGQSSLVETTSGTVGHTVDLNHVLELPLTERGVFGLINLAPAAFYFANCCNPARLFLGNFSMGGSRGQQGLALLDGVNNTRGGIGIQNIEMHPPPDALQEFRVQANNLSAEYGRTGGGVVNTVTKSGANELHGNFWEFLRNDKLDAAGWGNSSKPKLRRNIFGGTVGGPIRKDRTFFFYAYEGLLDRLGANLTRSSGLPQWRAGDFSTATRDAGGRTVPVPIYDPETGTGTFGAPRATLQFPGNVIPASRLDPVAVKALTFVPNGNRTPINPFNQSGNYEDYPTTPFDQHYHVARIDHDVDPTTRMFFRYMLAWPKTEKIAGATGYGAAADRIQNNADRLQNFALNVTRMFSPTFFLNFTAGVERLQISVRGACAWCGVNYPEQLGLRGVPGPGFPQFAFGEV